MAHNPNERTEHGTNIADQCVGEDAYGDDGLLTPADIYYILDMIHTNQIDSKGLPATIHLLERFRRMLESEFPSMEQAP